MLLWIVMALMTGAAVMAVLWPLSRRLGPSQPETRGDIQFYRDRLAEIDREVERGLISADQAEAVRAEAGRRLLRAHSGEAPVLGATGEPALRRRRAAAAFSLSVVPLIGLAVYGVLGSPQIPSLAAQDAAHADVTRDLPGALAHIEKHLAGQPNDGRGWELVAPIYLSMGRFDDAVKAYAAVRRLNGDSADRLTGYGEALVASAGGVVSAQAAEAFSRALALDPSSIKARFYDALAAEQDGDIVRARAGYERMAAEAGDGAPWLPVIRARLAKLGSGSEKVLAEGSVPPEVAAMVEGLDARLARDGGSEAEWSRLIRSFAVLGKPADARDRLAKARTALARNPDGLANLDLLARELGLLSREAAK